MRKPIVTWWCVAALSGNAVLAAASAANPAPRQVESLTLEQALEMAESLQPELAEAKAIVDAAEGRTRQAGTFPNPEAIVAAQQLPLTGDQPNEKEFVAGVGQAIPLGKRLLETRQAELLDREVRARGLEVKRRDIRKRVHSAFATALYQEKACQMQANIQHHAGQAVAITRARLEVGDASPEDVARVEMELARAKVELKRTESLHEQALLGLTSAIGDAALTVKSLRGTLDTTFEIPTLESLAANLGAQPESALAEAEVQSRQARLDVATAERIPDVKVELLYHRLEASSANTLDVGVSLPLPLFNRSQGRLREARAEVAAAEARSNMRRNELAARMRESHLKLTAALAASSTLQHEVLTRAETVLKGAEARYAAGDISLAEILPVRRDWAAVQLSYLESLRDVMQAWADVARYAGVP